MAINNDETMAIFSANLSRFMRKRNVSQLELAKAVGVSTASVNGYCNGWQMPRPKVLDKICQVLNVTSNQLFANEDEAHTIPLPSNIHVPDVKAIPIIGDICAGDGVFAEEDIRDYFYMDKTIKASFGLEVRGDSMVDADIRDGDLAFLQQTYTVEDGKIYGIFIKGESQAVLKILYKEEDGFLLVPANSKYRPVHVSEADIKIYGVLAGVLRMR